MTLKEIPRTTAPFKLVRFHTWILGASQLTSYPGYQRFFLRGFRCWLCLYCGPRFAARVHVRTTREKTSGTQGINIGNVFSHITLKKGGLVFVLQPPKVWNYQINADAPFCKRDEKRFMRFLWLGVKILSALTDVGMVQFATTMAYDNLK